MKQYEVVCLTKVNANLTDEIDSLLTKNAGKIKLSENWNQIKLSYPIKKEKEANFLVRIVWADTDSVLYLKKWPKLRKDVLRVLVINTEKEKSYVPNVTLSKLKITPTDFYYQITRGHKKTKLDWKESTSKGSNTMSTND